MPIFFSTTAATGFNSKFPSIFAGGVIDVYTGPQPETANHAPTGVKVAEVTAPGGLQFLMYGTYAAKDPAQPWTLQGTDDGIAGWFRLRLPADQGFAFDNTPRMDGAVWPMEDPRVGLVLPTLVMTVDINRPIVDFIFSF